MKPFHILGFATLIVLMLATVLVISAFNQPSQPTTRLNTAAIQSRINLPQESTDLSVVGSTTGIVIMGFLIVLIITIPQLLRKKRR